MKSKQAILAEPTQAYTMAGGIDPTMAYDMDDEESKDSVKEQEEVGPMLACSVFVSQFALGNFESVISLLCVL